MPVETLPLWTSQPKLTATSDLQAVGGPEADLTPYCIHSPTTNRCYWSVKAHQRPRRHVVSTSGQSYPLQSYLRSASRVSLQPSLTIPCLRWPASCLQEKGSRYYNNRLLHMLLQLFNHSPLVGAWVPKLAECWNRQQCVPYSQYSTGILFH